mgnify:CR=1 FL=1|tara:strand:- start:111 stop:845 length:735 start_codon:yes stop_codon:yes gene_type:complete
MQTGVGHIVRSPSTVFTDSCISILRLGCLPWPLRKEPTAVLIFRDVCMPQDGNVQFGYQNKTVRLLSMAHTPAACEETCRGFVCGGAHIARSKIAKCCLWAQALYVAVVREQQPPLDLGDGVCHPRTQHMPLVDCDWMHKIADDICPSAPRRACAAAHGLKIQALELEDSILTTLFTMSTLVALVLGFFIAQVCIICVQHVSRLHKDTSVVTDAGGDDLCGGGCYDVAQLHAALLPPPHARSCK